MSMQSICMVWGFKYSNCYSSFFFTTVNFSTLIPELNSLCIGLSLPLWYARNKEQKRSETSATTISEGMTSALLVPRQVQAGQKNWLSSRIFIGRLDTTVQGQVDHPSGFIQIRSTDWWTTDYSDVEMSAPSDCGVL